jgi:hypothetical protein
MRESDDEDELRLGGRPFCCSANTSTFEDAEAGAFRPGIKMGNFLYFFNLYD